MSTDHTSEQFQFKMCSNPDCPCENPQAINRFHKNSRNSNGLACRCKTCVANYHRQYYLENIERERDQTKQWQKNNPQKLKAKNYRRNKKNPEKYKARSAVGRAVAKGEILSASNLLCEHRGLACKGEARQYHHYLGYSEEHQLDVIPVCIPCHLELDRRSTGTHD